MFLGLDIGTGGAKALLIDEQGSVIAVAEREYSLSTPRPLWSEQDPEDWWEGAVESIRILLETSGRAGREIAAVGLTGQMHGLVTLDREGRCIRPAILWNDQRTAAQCDAIRERIGARELLRLTGNPVLTGFTAPKILWMREHEPEAYARIAAILLPKDFIRWKLTKEYFSDVSDASGTSLFCVEQRCWSDPVISSLDIPRSWLPEVTESPVVSARVSAEAARATGLTAGTPVVGGAGDQAAQAVGTGIVREGLLSATIGTSGVLFAASDNYRAEPEGKLHAFCHAVPGMWHLMGVMLSAGGSLRWFRNAFYAGEHERESAAGRDTYDFIAREAAEIPAGCEGLTFLPYLTGERTPHADPYARGAFVGCTLRHTRAHFARAVFEGIGFGLNDSLELIRSIGLPAAGIRSSGGGAKSGFWLQMLADIFGAPVARIEATEGAARGAALLAAVGAGAFRSVPEAAERAVRVETEWKPGAVTEAYRKLLPRFQALYGALKGEFRKLH